MYESLCYHLADVCLDDDVDMDLIQKVLALKKENFEKKAELAEINAEQLIIEEERLKRKQEKRREKKKKRKEKMRLKNDHLVSESDSVCTTVSDHSSKDFSNDVDLEFNSDSNSSVTKSTPLKNVNSNTSDGYAFGRQGNFHAEMGQFEEAIKCYTKAIQIVPNDSKLYGNRSCCYEKLEDYNKAFDDANKAIELDSCLPMNYFRKGLALSGLKKYHEAEQAFKEVLKLDPQCCYPIRELMLLRKAELMAMGFPEAQAYSAACTYKTVGEAVNGILENKILNDPLDHVFMSDEEEEENFTIPASTRNAKPINAMENKSTNTTSKPSEVSVWVGNILISVDDAEIKSLFKRFGEINFINILRRKVVEDCHCGFVVYKDASSAPKAIAALNGYLFHGKKLEVRYPKNPAIVFDSDSTAKTKDGESVKTKRVIINGECFYWRTIGACKHKDKCNFKHVPEHRLIDRK